MPLNVVGPVSLLPHTTPQLCVLDTSRDTPHTRGLFMPVSNIGNSMQITQSIVFS